MSMKKPTGAYQNAQPPAAPRRKKKNTSLHKLGRILTICLLIGIITGCIVASVMTVYILKYIGKENELVLENVKLGFTTILYAMDDATGEYFELQRIQSTENRIWVITRTSPPFERGCHRHRGKRIRTHRWI